MTGANLQVMQVVKKCHDVGAVLAVLAGDKLSIKGNKKAPEVSALVALVQQDRRAVLTAVDTFNMQRLAKAFQCEAQPQTITEDNTPAPLVTATLSLGSDEIVWTVEPAATLPLNPDYDAPVTADMLNDAGLFDVGQLAYYKQFVGQVVSDEQMTELYMDAHNHGFALTSAALGNWWDGCDHRVTGARFAKVNQVFKNEHLDGNSTWVWGI